MPQFPTRVASLLVGLLTFAAAALPSAADPQEHDDGWGQQAVEWCRDGHADESEPFGQCVSSRVHELKVDSQDEDDKEDHDGGWGQQAVAWCRDEDHADDFRNFG